MASPSVSPERIGIVGGGILGLALARELQARLPGTGITVFEKEQQVAQHQTGRNSGVVHAGLYYPPGSLKATLCTRGMRLLRDYCRDRRLPYDECGKLVVALDAEEVPRLEAIFDRATRNGVADVALVGPEQISEIEPHCAGVRALHSPRTAVVDFAAIARSFADDVRAGGGQVRTGARVTGLREETSGLRVVSTGGEALVDLVVNCAGLHADRVAELAGDDAGPRIVPFRGEYYRLRPQHEYLVRGLVYPVPDPRYPFLGVHLTKQVGGGVVLGPNAVLALAREGYGWVTVSPRDVWSTLRWPGFRRFARTHWRVGAAEVRRSLSKRRFIADAGRYVPALEPGHVERSPAGVRAQAMEPSGALVDDFRISRRGRVVNIRNAPSPAATASLAIAGHIAELLLAPA